MAIPTKARLAVTTKRALFVRRFHRRTCVGARSSSPTRLRAYELNDGDSVSVIKDLDVKGSSITLKRGEAIKNIRLTENEEQVECRVGKKAVVLKTCFLKKA